MTNNVHNIILRRIVPDIPSKSDIPIEHVRYSDESNETTQENTYEFPLVLNFILVVMH